MQEQEIKEKIPEVKAHQVIVQKKFIDCLKGLKFKTVLEYGCGFGKISKLLIDNFDIDKYVGFDISSGQIKNAKNKNLKNATFHHSQILDFEVDHKYDLVFGTGVLMHVPEKLIIPSFEKLYSFSSKYLMNMDSHYEVLPHRLARHCFNHDYVKIYTDNLGLDVKTTPMDKAVFVYHAKK